MWGTTLPNHSVQCKETENVAAGLFVFCSHNLKTALKGRSFQATYFIKEINSILQRDLRLTPFAAMRDL